MLNIVRLTIEQYDIIYDTVQLLLDELRDEPVDSGESYKEKILSDWKRNPDRHAVFAAYDGKNLAGIITLSENFAIYANGNYGIINELYVSPKYRSVGAGKLLIDRAREFGRERKWLRIDVTAPLGEKWERTVAFYLREGFVHTGPKLKIYLD